MIAEWCSFPLHQAFRTEQTRSHIVEQYWSHLWYCCTLVRTKSENNILYIWLFVLMSLYLAYLYWSLIQLVRRELAHLSPIAQALKTCADELSPTDQTLETCSDELTPIIAQALNTCADELSPIAQAFWTCADELPPIAQAGGNIWSSCSPYSSFRGQMS